MTPYGNPVWSTDMGDTLDPAAAVGARVSQILQDRGISQAQAAAALGMAQSQMSRRLSGLIAFNVVELDALARLCSLPPAGLLEDCTA